jgi:hypothetical protein
MGYYLLHPNLWTRRWEVKIKNKMEGIFRWFLCTSRPRTWSLANVRFSNNEPLAAVRWSGFIDWWWSSSDYEASAVVYRVDRDDTFFCPDSFGTTHIWHWHHSVEVGPREIPARGGAMIRLQPPKQNMLGKWRFPCIDGLCCSAVFVLRTYTAVASSSPTKSYSNWKKMKGDLTRRGSSSSCDLECYSIVNLL